MYPNYGSKKAKTKEKWWLDWFDKAFHKLLDPFGNRDNNDEGFRSICSSV